MESIPWENQAFRIIVKYFNRYKTQTRMKQMIRRLSILSLLTMALLPGALSARVILENENIVIEKAAKKIEEMGDELQQKTGVTYRIAAIQYLKNKETIRAHEEKIAADLKAPY